MRITVINAAEAFKKILSLEEKYIHIGEQTASYYTERDNDVLNIFFEWSNGKTDWKNNFDFPALPYRDMENKWHAHRGFLRVWKAIEPYIKEQIMDTGVKAVNIFGYSHGGAVALLCHEYCKFHRPDVSVLGYGFGAPRVVWGRLGKNVRERFAGFQVIRNERDIVTRVPPAMFGYWHPCLTSVMAEEKHNSIDAHRQQSYISALCSCGICVHASGELDAEDARRLLGYSVAL